MRALLISTGTPQAPGTTGTAIGPLPNLAAAIATYIPDGAVRPYDARTRVIDVGSVFSQSVTFRNSGGLAWAGAHRRDQAGLPTAPSRGGRSLHPRFRCRPVLPGDEVTVAFSLHAPKQVGHIHPLLPPRVTRRASWRSRRDKYHRRQEPGRPELRPCNPDDRRCAGIHRRLRGGQVLVTARNTGSTTWSSPRYGLRLTRTGRLALPRSSVPPTGLRGTRPVANVQLSDRRRRDTRGGHP